MGFLYSEHLNIRQFKLSDLDVLYSYRNDVNCARFQNWSDTSLEYLKEFINKQQDRILGHGSIQLAVASNDTDELIGDIYIAMKGAIITLGYTIAPKHQRKGYAYEILSVLIPSILSKYRGFEIICFVRSKNKPSRNLLEKLKFINEGYEGMLDSEIYSFKKAI